MIKRFTQRSKMFSTFSVEPVNATHEELLVLHPIIYLGDFPIRQRSADIISKGQGEKYCTLQCYRLYYSNGKLDEVIYWSNTSIHNTSLILDNTYFRTPRDIDGYRVGNFFFIARPEGTSTSSVRLREASLIAWSTLESFVELETMNSAAQIGVRIMTPERVAERVKRRKIAERKQEIRKRIEAMKKVRSEKIRKANREPLFQALEAAAKQVYPGRSEVKFSTYEKKEVIEVVVHFPEFEIVNSKGLKNMIRDLFVILIVDLEGRPFPGFYGARTTLTYAEFVADYAQSHLQSSAMRTRGSFCLGSSNVNTLITDMRYSPYFTNKEKWIRRFEALLFQLEAFVSWESLEGVPYHYIKDIAIPGEKKINEENECKKLIKALNPNDPPPMIFVKGRGFQLSTNTEQFEDWLVKYTTCRQFRNSSGEFYSDSDLSVPRQDFEIKDSVPFVFKDIVHKRIVRSKNNESKERKEYCHRKVKEEFVRWANSELERTFTEKSLRSIFRGILTVNVKKASTSYTIGSKGQTQGKSEFKGILKNFKAVSAVSDSRVVRNSLV